MPVSTPTDQAHLETSRPTISSPRPTLLRLHPLRISPIDIQIGDLHMAGEHAGISPSAHVLGDRDSGDGEFFDLRPPMSAAVDVEVEDVMKKLFSTEHLHFILTDHSLFLKFSSFLNQYRPNLVPALVRYLEMRKATKAIEYANAIAKSIQWPSHTDFYKFSRIQAASMETRFKDCAARELLLLRSEALPAFVAHTLIKVAADCVSADIMGQTIPIVRDRLGNLAEVYCLTDPSTPDNPIIFASEEFHKTTQYGTSYAINRNCRFLQGPGTDKETTLRLAKAISLGRESNEVLLNYRRDGTPFVNLLMCSPLYDDKGVIRYFIGAQIDVTGLVIDGLGIESFRALLQNDDLKKLDAINESQNSSPHLKSPSYHPDHKTKESLKKLQELSTMFSQYESEVACKNSRGWDDSTEADSIRSTLPTSVKNRGLTKRVIGNDEINLDTHMLSCSYQNNSKSNSILPGVYRHYLLVRPYPSLQIIFVSPSLRIPGLLRTHLFTKIGGSAQTISALESAFRDGASVTAKVLWLPKNTLGGPPEGKPRFIRCTPLFGSDNSVGVWMVNLIPVDSEPMYYGYRRDPLYEMVDEAKDDIRRFGGSTSPRKSHVRGVRRSQSVESGIGGIFGLANHLGARREVSLRQGEVSGANGHFPIKDGNIGVEVLGNGNRNGNLEIYDEYGDFATDDRDEKEMYAEFSRVQSST